MKLLKRVAAVGAASLVAGAMVSVPASAASGTLNYTCAAPLLGAQPFTVTVDTDAPTTVQVGQAFSPNITATSTCLIR